MPDNAPDALICVEVTLAAAHPALEDAIEAQLFELGALGVERQDDGTFSELVEEPRRRAPGSIRWRVYAPLPDDPDAFVAPYRDLLDEVATVDAWVLDDLSFLTRWKAFFRPSRVSRRVWVHPPWDIPTAKSDEVLVEIEPGMAFGTGTHETTRLCIGILDDLLANARPSVLDVGCGSGVLSIVAAKLGAARVEAVDNDPDAVRIANENFALNRAKVVATTQPCDAIDGTFDIVVANILPHVLIALADPLCARASGGTLVLSGITNAQRGSVLDAFTAKGLELLGDDSEGDWHALTWRVP